MLVLRLLATSLFYAALADGVVDTHAHVIVAAQWNELLAELTNAVVGTDEEVEATGMEVENPTNVGTKCTDAAISTNLEHLGRTYGNCQALLVPAVNTLDTCCAQKTELQVMVVVLSTVITSRL